MVANIISRRSFQLQDIIAVSDYEIALDSDYGGKSQVTFHRKPNAEEEDFIILHDKGAGYQGLIDNIERAEDGAHYILTLMELPKLFDQKLIVTNEALLKIGIEDFIANQITDNFISNVDERVNLPYLAVTARTHTPVAAKVRTEEGGIYNLCTYIGNALTNYGIFMNFSITRQGIDIVLEKKEQADLKIDTGASELQNVSEVYEVKALTKLTVVWRRELQPEGTEGGEQAEPIVIDTIRQFFLKTDRTITEDMEEPERAKGMTDTLLIQAETEAEMWQEVRNQFKGNSYQHKISFDLAPTARLIKPEDLYIGHACKVKTESGIKDSFLSRITYGSSRSSIGISLGNMKIGLVEKLKGVEKAR